MEAKPMKRFQVEDLKRIKEAMAGVVNLRDGAYRAKITVHMGTCGIAAGADRIMKALHEKMEKGKVDDILLTSSGCAGLCNHEPMITVEIKDSPPVKYIRLDPHKVSEIFDEHVVKGKPVTAYALAVGSETTY
jgi:NADP-reducing hydrogenase subunit HndB